MEKNSIVINRPGVYLFHAPTKISLQINRELLLLLSVPERSLVGLLLLDQTQHQSDIPALLDTLLGKLRKDLLIGTHQIRAKLIGLSTPNPTLKAVVGKWLDANHLKTVAEDTGRSVARKIFIDCESGLAGVSYAEGFVEKSWLDDGSAKKRTDATTGDLKVLALTKSAVKRKLCRQSVDELSNWISETPDSPFDFISVNSKDLSQYTAIVIFDDLTKDHEKPLKRFIQNLLEKYPNAKAFWVGKKRPAYATHFLTLPQLTPTQVKKFKKAMQSELNAVAGVGPGEVIAFPKPAKKVS